jgi:hypothetical protein
LERETTQRRKEEKEKLAAQRHQEHLDAVADLKKVISDHHGTDDKWRTTYADTAKDKEKRRTEKTTKEKHWQSAFDKLLAEVETDKKWREAESKKPGADAVIDFLKKSNEDQTTFLRALAADIMAQNADQHKTTKEAAKTMAREQVAFNVAGYLDDFSKTLSVSLFHGRMYAVADAKRYLGRSTCVVEGSWRFTRDEKSPLLVCVTPALVGFALTALICNI